MADVSKIKLPNGTTYDIKDNVSGYTTNTGTITKVQTTAGAHTTINVSSGAAAFNVPTKTSHLTNDSGFITGYTETDPTVPSWAKASTKPSYTASEVGAVPTTRKVNGKALSADITLSASDVSALPSSTVIPTITDTYSGTSSNGMSGKAVKSAIDALDGSISGSVGAGKTLTAFSQTDGKVSATFGNISITKSQISDFPTIPTVNNATLTIQKNGTTVKTFTANASSNVTANISVPTKTSDLTNDSGYITDVKSDGTSVVTSGVANIDTFGGYSAASKGLVPAPPARSGGGDIKVLRDDATWASVGITMSQPTSGPTSGQLRIAQLGTSAEIPVATTLSNGAMSAADKIKLNGIAHEIYLIDCDAFDTNTITDVTYAYNAGKTLVCKFNIGTDVCYASLYSADISSPPNVEFRFHAMDYSSSEPALIMMVLTSSGWTMLNHNSFANIYDIPTATSELTNDSGFITDVKVKGQSVVTNNVANLSLNTLGVHVSTSLPTANDGDDGDIWIVYSS